MRRCFPAAYLGEGLWQCAPAAVYFTANGHAELAASTPNIILIICDDIGYSDLGCYGVEFLPSTLDALAARWRQREAEEMSFS